MINKLQIEATPSTIDYTPPFCAEITDNIINNNTVAVSDALLKSNKMGRY